MFLSLSRRNLSLEEYLVAWDIVKTRDNRPHWVLGVEKYNIREWLSFKSVTMAAQTLSGTERMQQELTSPFPRGRSFGGTVSWSNRFLHHRRQLHSILFRKETIAIQTLNILFVMFTLQKIKSEYKRKWDGFWSLAKEKLY